MGLIFGQSTVRSELADADLIRKLRADGALGKLPQ
jgi:hypothetical protein